MARGGVGGWLTIAIDPPILSRFNPSCGIGHPGTVVLSTGPTASDTWAGRMLLCAILTASLDKVKVTDQWLFLVPLKGGRWHIIPHLAVYTTYIPLIYILPSGGLYATYHLLGEPGTTIELRLLANCH